MRRIKSEMSKSKTHFVDSARFDQHMQQCRNKLCSYAYLIIMMMIVIIEVIAVCRKPQNVWVWERDRENEERESKKTS